MKTEIRNHFCIITMLLGNSDMAHEGALQVTDDTPRKKYLLVSTTARGAIVYVYLRNFGFIATDLTDIYVCYDLAGCTVLVIGAWLRLEPSKSHLLNLFVPNDRPHDTINLIAHTLLCLGFTVFTVGIFGCWAASRENQCILATYMSILVALILTELVLAAVGGVMTFRILSGLEGRLISKLANDYGHEQTTDIPFSNSLDFVQYKFNCCGIHGYGDYNGTAWWRDAQFSGNRRQVPLTCCVLKNTEIKNTGSPMSVVSRVFHKNKTEKPWLNPKPKDEVACQLEDKEGHDGYRHKVGCLDKVTGWLQYESFTLVFLGMAMAGIQTFGIITSAFLCRTIRDMQVD